MDPVLHMDPVKFNITGSSFDGPKGIGNRPTVEQCDCRHDGSDDSMAFDPHSRTVVMGERRG